jgi:hypothetical protein
MKKKEKERSRNFQFTINNYTKSNLKELKNISELLEKHDYICYGLEIAPETGTKHIQGYIQLNTPMTFQGLQKYFNLKDKKKELIKFHCEIARQSSDVNIKYTSKTRKEDLKSNEIWLEYGTPKQQGQRSDLSELKKLVFDDPKNSNQIIKNQDLNYQQLRYVETIQKYAFEHRNPENPPKVFWLWGASGTGKTKKVFDEFGIDNIYALSDFQWLGEGYKQQECYLIDDFRHNDIKFNFLLKLLDRYPFTLSFKGGSIPMNSPYIVITSNQSIQETFGGQLNIFEDLQQLFRRVNEFHILEINNIFFKDIQTLQDF